MPKNTGAVVEPIFVAVPSNEATGGLQVHIDARQITAVKDESSGFSCRVYAGGEIFPVARSTADMLALIAQAFASVPLDGAG